MYMELVFVDSQLKVIPAGSPKEQRFAIDLCYKGFFAGEPLPFLDKHFFVSAQPWAQNMTLSEARSYLRSLEKLNPDVVRYIGNFFCFDISLTRRKGIL